MRISLAGETAQASVARPDAAGCGFAGGCLGATPPPAATAGCWRRALHGLCVAAGLVAGCTPLPPAAPPAEGAAPADRAAPALGWFSRIRVPEGQEVALRLAARGAQIFRCELAEGAYRWRFRQPEAELVDAEGRVVGKHGASFSFEHRDGSRLLGTVLAHEAASAAADLPWLLLSARSYGKGEFAGVTYVQRVDTRGGMPPPACAAAEAGRLLRVDFRADFVFYRPRG